MPVIPAGFGQVTHFFTGAAVPTGAAVTYGVSTTATDPNNIMTPLHDAWGQNVQPQVVNGCNLESTLVKLGPNQTGPSAQIFNLISGGGVAAEGVTPAVAWLIVKNTALGGRRGKGRMFVPGLSEERVGPAGIILVVDQGNLQTAVNAWFGAVNSLAAIGDIVLLHSEGKTGLPVPSVVTSVFVASMVATQRRRQRR